CLIQAYFSEDTGWRGTYASQDHFANLLAMSLPFAIMYPAIVLRRLDLRRRAAPLRPILLASLFFGLAALILLGIVFSTSPTGFLAGLAALLLMGLVAWGIQAPVRKVVLAASLTVVSVV